MFCCQGEGHPTPKPLCRPSSAGCSHFNPEDSPVRPAQCRAGQDQRKEEGPLGRLNPAAHHIHSFNQRALLHARHSLRA